MVDLKGRLGWGGFVMSDWGAGTLINGDMGSPTPEIMQGLDMVMPGGSASDLVNHVLQDKDVAATRVDDAARRVLTQMYTAKLQDSLTQWTAANLPKNPTTNASIALARKLAGASMTLLKNEGGILPLSTRTTKSVAIFGWDAYAPTTGGSGSGGVGPTQPDGKRTSVSPLDGLTARVGGPAPPLPPCSCNSSTFLSDTDFYHEGDRSIGSMASPEDCCAPCSDDPTCGAWTFFGSTCYLHDKRARWQTRANAGATSCTCDAHPAPNATSPVDISYHWRGTGKDDAATYINRERPDVSLVFLSTSSGEAVDRANTSLPDDQLALVEAVAGADNGANAKRTIVVVVTPGSTLLPFADSVAAVVWAVMPGQEYGNAIADVLFGDVNPSGRLTVTVANKENEVGFTQNEYPGIKSNPKYPDILYSNYTEGLLVGYRWYNMHGVSPRFCFGHGLSYTKFAYDNIQVVPSSGGGTSSSTSSPTATSTVTVHVDIINTGSVAGSEVAQLYLSFPAGAGEPPRQLRGFEKTQLLAPGQHQTVEFELDSWSRSTWDAEAHSWQEQSGDFEISVGASVCDIRASVQFSNGV